MDKSVRPVLLFHLFWSVINRTSPKYNWNHFSRSFDCPRHHDVTSVKNKQWSALAISVKIVFCCRQWSFHAEFGPPVMEEKLHVTVSRDCTFVFCHKITKLSGRNLKVLGCIHLFDFDGLMRVLTTSSLHLTKIWHLMEIGQSLRVQHLLPSFSKPFFKSLENMEFNRKNGKW